MALTDNTQTKKKKKIENAHTPLIVGTECGSVQLKIVEMPAFHECQQS